MKIRFRCPSGHRLSVPESWAGRQVRCASCKQAVYVPQHAGDASAQPKAPSEKGRSRSSRRPSSARATAAGATFAGGYRADAGKVSTVRWLALLLAMAVALSLCPVAWSGSLDLQAAAGWARIVVLIAMVQAFYIAWMLNRPDWSSVWVVMLVFAGVAAVYGAATAIALVTPPERPMPLGMGPVRHWAGSWCAAVLLVMSLATYLCGRSSARWRRSVQRETVRGHAEAG